MGHQRRMQITEYSLPLQPPRRHRRQQTLHESATPLTDATQGVLPPQHATTQQTLRMVVGRLDPFFRHELPQSPFDVLQVGAKRRRLGIGAASPRLQQPMQVSDVRVEAKAQLAAVDGAAAEQMPLLEDTLADPLQLSSTARVIQNRLENWGLSFWHLARIR
jgi:hypothetical protein